MAELLHQAAWLLGELVQTQLWIVLLSQHYLLLWVHYASEMVPDLEDSAQNPLTYEKELKLLSELVHPVPIRRVK